MISVRPDRTHEWKCQTMIWNGTEWDKSAQYIYDIDEQRNALLYVEYVYGPKL